MIQMIKSMTDCRIFIGENGIIWIDGDEKNAEVAARAIEMIGENAHKGSLTERVKEFIEKELPNAGEVGE